MVRNTNDCRIKPASTKASTVTACTVLAAWNISSCLPFTSAFLGIIGRPSVSVDYLDKPWRHLLPP